MTLKEKIENNLTLYTLGLLLSGFLAGVSVHKFLVDAIGVTPKSESEYTTETWHPIARKELWIPTSECPAFAIDVKITSPGNNSVVGVDQNHADWLRTPIVITTNRPLPEQSNIGLAIKPSDGQNIYVVFPGFEKAGSGNTYRNEPWVDLPVELRSGTTLELRALVVDDKRKIGVQFTSIEQIKSADPSVYVGEPVSITVK